MAVWPANVYSKLPAILERQLIRLNWAPDDRLFRHAE